MGNVFSRELPQNPAHQAVPAHPTPEMGFAGAGVTLGGLRAHASMHNIVDTRSRASAEPSLVHTSRTTAAPLSSAATTMDAVPRAIVVKIPEPREDAKHVVIVGGGAAGLIMLKTIMDTPQYTRGDWTVTLLEAREDIGGVWLPSTPDAYPPATPLYDSTATNVAHPFMWLHDFPFPPSTPLCPNAAAVLAYLKAYAAHNKIAANIRLRTRVAAACPASKGARHHWDVELVSGEVLSADLLVAASGQYHAPRLPDTAGLYAWLTSGRATHTVTYRRPDAYAGRRVLLVGAGPSGYDIREELERAGAHVVHSITGGVSSPYWPMPAPGTRVRPRAAEYRADGSVLFVDGVLEHVDCALLATGYDISFPWLDAVFRPPGAPPAVPPLPNALYNSRKHVFPLARHTWPLAGAGAPPHALAIIGLGDNVSFFPLFEAQARAVAHVFAEPQALDVERERAAVLARAEEMQRTLSPEELAKRWHEFGTDMIPFINGMNALAGDLGVPGSELPPVAA